MTVQPDLNQAVSAYRAGNLAEAELLCQSILEGGENTFDALHLLALVQAQLGKTLAGLATYDRVLSLRPQFALGHFQRGLLLNHLNRNEEALASFELAVRSRAEFAAAHFRRGMTLVALGRHREALESYEAALRLRPNWAEVYYSRGNALQDLHRLQDALLSYDEALRLSPQLAEAYTNRGNVLFKLNRLNEALASHDQALSLRPELANAHSNRGAVLQNLGRYEDAVASFDAALKLRPDATGALTNRGIVLHHLGRYEEATDSFDRALQCAPDNAEAHFAKALCRLLLGEFEQALPDYEWRWQAEFLRHKKRHFEQPLWLGDADLAGKTILLHAEQGFGDTIQFCRYVPLVAERGARVILEAEPQVRKLVNGLAGAAEIVAAGAPLPAFDLHCPLLSLPLAFGTTTANIPSRTPYLHAPSEAVLTFEQRLRGKLRPRIGMFWSGRPRKKSYPERSIALRSVLPLVSDRATFVSLQKDLAPDDLAVLNERADILNFAELLTDFADTAALIENLDLVISIDTSVAHLAGALGKPLWVLLPFPPDWRWLLGRSDCPWYPTARLFRQDQTRAWDGVLFDVGEALQELIAREA